MKLDKVLAFSQIYPGVANLVTYKIEIDIDLTHYVTSTEKEIVDISLLAHSPAILVSATFEKRHLDRCYILQLTCRSMQYLKKYSQTSCKFMLASANMNKYIVFT